MGVFKSSGGSERLLPLFPVFLPLILFIFPGHVTGFTSLQLINVIKLVETSVQQVYPDDTVDYIADILVQVVNEAENKTVYHGGDPKAPVFVCSGVGHSGSKVHVLRRGEDYLNHADQNNFVVLRQTSNPEQYSVHTAHIQDMKHIAKSKVTWMDDRIEQQPNSRDLLGRMGNQEVQARAVKSQRPLCDWIGSLLLCNAKQYVEPLRERAPIAPMDKEDAAPRAPPNIISEETGDGPSIPQDDVKQKRNIVSESRLMKKKFISQVKKDTSKRAGNELNAHEPGSEEEKIVGLKPIVNKVEETPEESISAPASSLDNPNPASVVDVLVPPSAVDTDHAEEDLGGLTDGSPKDGEKTKKRHKKKRKGNSNKTTHDREF